MFDLKVISSVLDQMEEERGIPKEKVIEAIEMALATAYKKEYGKKGQIIRSTFSPETGDAEFYQVKVVVDDEMVVGDDEEFDESQSESEEGEEKVVFNVEQHILLSDARKMKKDVEPGEEMTFELENQGEYGRIASQTAKQVIIQKIREAEKTSVMDEYAGHVGEIVSGSVQRVERGNIFIDLGRATGLLPREEQIPGERFRQGERIRAYLLNVEESSKGVFVRLSRSHPKFLEKLFEVETPELGNGSIVLKGIAREPGSRSKIAAAAVDEHIDPVGALVGQRGVRVSTVMSELGGEKIDIIEYSEDPAQFIEDSLSPAEVIEVEVDEENRHATVNVAEDQQSLAIGKAGQNVRLAAKLTGYKIDIRSAAGESVAEADSEGVEIHDQAAEPEAESAPANNPEKFPADSAERGPEEESGSGTEESESESEPEAEDQESDGGEESSEVAEVEGKQEGGEDSPGEEPESTDAAEEEEKSV